MKKNQNYFIKWSNKSTVYKFYLSGFSIACISTFLLLMTGDVSGAITFFNICAVVSFALGYANFIAPKLHAAYQKYPIKKTLLVIHALILYLAIIPARFFFSKAIGLPPEDFEKTISLIALELYPAIWFFIFAGINSIIYILFLLCAGLCFISTLQPIDFIISNFVKLLPSEHTIQKFILHGRRDYMQRSFGHAIGAAIFAVSAAYIWQLNQNFLLGELSPIKWLAYEIDYFDSYKIPGIEKQKYSKIHQNGIVSYATVKNGNVVITMDKFREP